MAKFRAPCGYATVYRVAGAATCCLLGSAASVTAAPVASHRAVTAAPATSARQLQGDTRLIHVLNRLAFGPRPGEVEQVRKLGVDRWIDAQLAPEAIDDSAVDAKLARLTTLKMPAGQLQLAYVGDTAAFVKALAQSGGMAQRPDVTRDYGTMQPQGQVSPVDMTKVDLKPEQRRILDQLANSGLPRGLSVQAVGELSTAKITRAVESKRQLQEVLVDFWSNHFNLDVKKGPVRTSKLVDDRDVIRPHVLGKFRDLLGASAKSPAMLFYLDNARSTRAIDPALLERRRRNGQTAPRPQAATGVNENYARELMELHTLGVDGGYTQKDVQEVARCLTGWGIDRASGEFMFHPFLHDNGAKVVLGHDITAGGGIQDGEHVLDILSSHPSTAHFIARKLCVRLVIDDPPAALVERTAKTFLDTGGDLKAVVQAIVTSPEFDSQTAYHSKIKSPFEFAVSAVRALGGSIEVPDPTVRFGRLRLVVAGAASLNQGGGGAKGMLRRFQQGPGRKSMAEAISDMGEPLFSYQAPTGYTEQSASWVSAGALIARLNFALALTGGEVADATVSPTDLLEGVTGDDHNVVLDRLSQQLLGTALSPGTQDVIKRQIPAGTPANAARVSALILGSPEFQRR